MRAQTALLYCFPWMQSAEFWQPCSFHAAQRHLVSAIGMAPVPSCKQSVVLRGATRCCCMLRHATQHSMRPPRPCCTLPLPALPFTLLCQLRMCACLVPASTGLGVLLARGLHKQPLLRAGARCSVPRSPPQLRGGCRSVRTMASAGAPAARAADKMDPQIEEVVEKIHSTAFKFVVFVTGGAAQVRGGVRARTGAGGCRVPAWLAARRSASTGRSSSSLRMCPL